MSVQDLGRRLLGEVEDEVLSETIGALRLQNDRGTASSIGFTPIDNILKIFHTSGRPPQDTSPAAPAHQIHRQGQTTQRPACVELASPRSSDGKSQLLYYLITITILPFTFGNVQLEGQNASVVFIDADGHFSVTRLIQVLEGYVADRLARLNSSDKDGPSPIEMASLIESALQHVHILQPQSASSLLSTLEHLPAYLFDRKSHYSIYRKVNMIILDSATAFYWNDRYKTDLSHIPDSPGDASADRPARTFYPKLRALLTNLSRELSCSIVYTTSNLFHRPSTVAERSLEPALPRSWTTFPHLRLIVQRRQVRGFPTAISAEEAAKDAGDRVKAMSEGIFDVSVNEYGDEEWSREVAREMYRSSRGRFVLGITAEGVVLRSIFN